MSAYMHAEDLEQQLLARFGAGNSQETCIFDDEFEPHKGETMFFDKSQPPTPTGTGLPINFHIIAPGVFRSSYPQLVHYNELETLDLKTIITLVKPDPAFSASNNFFIAKNKIQHHNIVLTPNKPEDQKPRIMEVELVTDVVKMMLDRNNYPIMIHCNKGKHRTGCTSAVFRIATGWSTSAAIAEYVKHADGKDREADKKFIAAFDATELKVLALERGFVGGIYAEEYVWSSQSSLRTESGVV